LISKKPSKSPVEAPHFTLEYCKLEPPIDAAPAGKDGKFNKNVKAMVKALYVTLKSEEFLYPFASQGTIHFVDQTSFDVEVNQYAQDHQFMFMIVKHFILPAVKTE
jgi:hypothetical protein